MSWESRRPGYGPACRRAADGLRLSPEASAFKVDPDYAGVVGYDARPRLVPRFLELHRRSRPIEAIAELTAPNDRYGQPRLCEAGGHAFSAASLKYLQVADEIGGAPEVVEVGGGYGGQRLLCAGVGHYVIYDIPQALELAAVYLKLHGLGAELWLEGEWRDLQAPGETYFLSDHALSELTPEQIGWYVKAVACWCAAGRITCHSTDLEKLTRALDNWCGELRIEDEAPPSSTAERHKNYVVRWG